VVAEAPGLRRAAPTVALAVAASTERVQILQHVAPATLARENVIDLGGERPACDAEEVIPPERPRPEPSPSAGRASALRMLGHGSGFAH
jgi:hypothetical protein